MERVEQPIRLPARRFLSFNFLLISVIWLITATFLCLMLAAIAEYTLAPWNGVCCLPNYPPSGSWERISNDFFEDHVWLAYVPTLLLAGYCLARFGWRVAGATRPERVVAGFILLNVFTFAAGIAWSAALAAVLKPLTGAFDWLAVSYGAVSHADLLLRHLALWPTMVLLALIYSGYPRSWWAGYERVLARYDPELDDVDHFEKPAALSLPRYLDPIFLITCVLLLPLSLFMLMLVGLAVWYALSPWTQYCCSISWSQALTEFFRVGGWIAVALTMLELAAIELLQFIRRVVAASKPDRVALVFLLVNALAILAGWALFVTSTFVLDLLDSGFHNSANDDGSLTYGEILSFNLALWPVLVALVWVYSGRPRSFWANMLDY